MWKRAYDSNTKHQNTFELLVFYSYCTARNLNRQSGENYRLPPENKIPISVDKWKEADFIKWIYVARMYAPQMIDMI